MLFISWAPFCSRSDNLAREFGGTSVMIYHGWWGSNYLTVLLKYLTQSLATVWLLVRRRPRLIFVMTPPAIACLPVMLYAAVFRARWVIDAHTATFNHPRWQALGFLQRFLSRHAVTTIVTTPHWQSLVASWGARSDIVQDVPIAFPPASDFRVEPGPSIATVCTFTFDEPMEAIFRAAAQTPDVRFYVTGNAKRAAPELLAMKPPNVQLTGFVPAEDYVALLKRCTAVMCLTMFDHTMQRGAYEAAYLGKPIITSDFGILRDAFPRGAVFVKDDADAISAGVRRMCEHAAEYETEAQRLRDEKHQRWARVKSELTALLFEPR